MSQPTTTTALSARHLASAVVPATDQPERALSRAVARVDAAISLGDAFRVRLPWLPPPARQETLAELVQVARRRVREDHARVQSDELGARRRVLDGVLRELTP